MTHGPEWVGEIAASRSSYDVHDKKEAYRRNGVREYTVWRVEDAAVDWYVLRGGRYDQLHSDGGVYRSEVFPGLWLDFQALLEGDMQRVFQCLQDGLASAEHAHFVKRLSQSQNK